MAAIDEITQVPSNATVIKIINALIKRYNSLADVYTFKGSVETYNDLLAIQNPTVGDVYNVKQEDAEHGVAAGSNFVWDGNVWDNLGMSLDGLVRKINGFTPDDLGTVIFQYIKNITDNDGTLTITVRNGEEESTLTIDTGKVKTVNGVEPDESGNITIEVPQPTIATQAEAEAGTNNTKFMTPLRTKQAIEAQVQGLPVGFEFFTLNPTIQAGTLPLLGGTYSRETYKDLWAWVQTQTGYLISETEWQSKSQANNGNVPFYSSGDGSTTFRVPSLKCWVKGANGIEEVGSYLEASFPAHKHDIGFDVYPDGSSLYGTKSITNSKQSRQAGWGSASIATKSSYTSTEGQGTAIQPESIVGVWCVKAFGTVSNVGNQDVAELSSEVTRIGTQVDEVADAVSGIKDYIVQSYRNGTEWYEIYKSGKIRQGGALPLKNYGTSWTTINLLKPYSNTNYSVFTSNLSNDVNVYGWFKVKTDTFTKTSFQVSNAHNSSSQQGRWCAEGV